MNEGCVRDARLQHTSMYAGFCCFCRWHNEHMAEQAGVMSTVCVPTHCCKLWQQRVTTKQPSPSAPQQHTHTDPPPLPKKNIHQDSTHTQLAAAPPPFSPVPLIWPCQSGGEPQ